jgi:hypothetical protein
VLWCFRQDSADPKRRRAPKGEVADDLGGGRALLCAHCGRRITRESFRIDVGGDHRHTRVNPHGIRFTFGCFARADGCQQASAPSSEWSWFPGYRWQIEACGGCGHHLGWRFDSGDHAFHGLVLDRLVEGPEDDDEL